MVTPSLLASIQAGNKAAFKELYDSCAGYVYAITKRYVSNSSDHPDVMQEIFARVFLSIDSYQPAKGEFKSWLRRLAINRCMQHYRQGKSPRVHVSLEVVSQFSSDGEEVFSKLSKDEIMAYLGKMPEGYRQIFMLVVMDDYSHKEVAELLSISPQTSRSQLSRAKKWLQDHIPPSNKKILLVNGL